MFNKKILCYIFLSFLLIGTVSSAPPITDVKPDEGYDIWATMNDHLITGRTYEWELHVSNQSNGMPITQGISCYAHLYNNSGNHQAELEDSTASHLFDYSFTFDGGNFTRRGEHIIKFNCNDSTYGGGTELEFWVNDYGEMLDEPTTQTHNNSMWFLMILFGLSLAGIFFFESPAGKLACYYSTHVIFIIGTFAEWQFIQGYRYSYVATAGIFKVLFYVSITALLPMVLLSVVWMFYIHLMNDDIKKMMDRGMDEDEATARAKEKKKW